MAYTIALNEAETQLRKLVEQTQTTHMPVVLTAEGTQRPIAVLLESNAFEESERNRQRLFHLERAQLLNWLDRVQEKWDDPSIRQKCVTIWQENIKTLWDVGPTRVRGFCASLALSVQQLDADHLSLEQVAALHTALTVLQAADPDESAIQVAYQKLRESRLPPRLTFEREVAQSYIDES